MACRVAYSNNMFRMVLIKTLLGICCSAIWFASSVDSSRADLGTYLNIKEVTSTEEKIAEDSVIFAYINYTYRSADATQVHLAEEKARYGEGKVLTVHGYLIHVTALNNSKDHTGCNPEMSWSHGISPHNIPWIALVRRGVCTFEEKIKNAYAYKALGVIVYNDESSMNLEKMKIIDKERNITAVFTHKWIGEEMARVVDEGNRVWISIIEGQHTFKSLANINKTSVLFVSISFIVLMIISLVWLIFYYVQRFRYLQSKDQHSRHLCNVAKRIIGKIPTKSGKNEDKDGENDCCPICIEPYKATDCIRILPCKHEFHKNCIDPWLLEHRTCPMCKLDVLKHYGFVVGDPSIKLTTSQNAQNSQERPNILSSPVASSSQIVIHSQVGTSASSHSISHLSGVTASHQVTDV